MLNDQLGDCTCAAVGHSIQLLTTSSTGVEFTPPDSAILELYKKVSGYNPNDPSTDCGAVEIDVLNEWRQSGLCGHTISAYAAVTPSNINHVKLAIQLFGFLYVGLALPKNAEDQDGTWTVVAGPDAVAGSLGGHAVIAVDYDADGVTFITWGQLKKATWAWWNAYCDEAYAVISPDDIKPNSTLSFSGVDVITLQKDLNLI